jgi:site-specific recombinase XerD
MDPEPRPTHQVAVARQMLRRVLEGDTYDAVAADLGITRTAVERRVKALALRLCREVGVPGLNEAGTSFVGRLRAVRGAALEALDNLQPAKAASTRGARIVASSEVTMAIARIQARSPEPLRDVALFCMLFATGARPLEIARLRVRDYLASDGTVRRQSDLPAQASIVGRARPLFFASGRLDEAMERYLLRRVSLGHGVGTCSGVYRALDPDGALFLTSSGEPFRITCVQAGRRQRSLCRGILETFGRIFRYAQLEGATALSARRTVAARLFERGADDRQVGLLLGIGDLRGVRALRGSARCDLDALVEDLI